MLIQGWALINFSYLCVKVGAYSRWALIRGWALNRINTVFTCTCTCIGLLLVSISQPICLRLAFFTAFACG